MTSLQWQPLATKETLMARAQLLAKIRLFFTERSVLEVDVPVLGLHSVSDPFLDAIEAQVNGQVQYLQTSPEYFMKRLLAAGMDSIYYLGKSFRADEVGRFHSPEFTMLEWYRLGFDDQQLIQELIALLQFLKPDIAVQQTSYGELFQRLFALDVHQCDASELEIIAKQHLDVNWQDDKSGWLDLIFSHLVEPTLGTGLHVVYDYPVCQSALAKVVKNTQGQPVAKRFECFLNTVELANGYWELTDAQEQARRFQRDNQKRKFLAKVEREPDVNLLAALEQGLPECAGVALGVDRLMMALLELNSVGEQRCF